EVNVSNWDTNDSDKEARMAHALGTVETVFSHARLGLSASHYWIWPTHRWDGTEYPVFKAYEKLRDHMGDTLLSSYAFRNIRVYTTRDSRTGELAIWALNFSNDEQTTLNLNLANLPRIEQARLFRLVDHSGPTTLFSINTSSEMGAKVINVDWTSSNITSQFASNYSLTLPAATLTLLVLQPGLPPLTPVIAGQGGQKTCSIQFPAIPYSSERRYQLHSSDDLLTWNLLTEVAAGTNQTISIPDPRPLNATRFYRVTTQN
ncbi:MAG: hypothetical protein ACK4UN_04410, partial [Limisphaerales bacterium]